MTMDVIYDSKTGEVLDTIPCGWLNEGSNYDVVKNYWQGKKMKAITVICKSPSIQFPPLPSANNKVRGNQHIPPPNTLAGAAAQTIAKLRSQQAAQQTRTYNEFIQRTMQGINSDYKKDLSRMEYGDVRTSLHT